MELVKVPAQRRKGFVRRDALSQLCDAGDRLEYVLGRYTRLVSELGEGTGGVPDLSGRVQLINSQLVYVAQRLQEILILEHESARADALASEEACTARRTAFPRPVVRASA
jgi:hypothetical protein